jgi:hypothetical protein
MAWKERFWKGGPPGAMVIYLLLIFGKTGEGWFMHSVGCKSLVWERV